VAVKGQMARVDVSGPPLSHVVKHGLPYVVPRTRGSLVVGTTSEDVGFDRRVHASDVAAFVRDMETVVPALAGARLVETWAGFRPRLADGLPALGPVEAVEGLHVATGHYRNGILLAESTGVLVAEAVLGRVDPCLATFSPSRFHATPHAGV
jgi:glycine oxidase